MPIYQIYYLIAFFFLWKRRGKNDKFSAKSFLILLLFLKAQRYKRQMKRPRSQLTSSRESSQTLKFQSPGHHPRTSKPEKASQKFCDLIFLHYRREKLLFVLRAFVTDFRSSLLFTFICFVSRAGKTRSGEQRREALNEQLENCFSHTLQT